MTKKIIVLTGDRPTGPLHLGHYVGSLLNRIELQDKYKQFVMLADIQALTDNMANPHKIRDNILDVVLDYLAVGIDPTKTTIFLQSMIPEIAELAILYGNFVTLNRLKRNPTVKTEIQQKGYGDSVTVGFLTYPIHQAADITLFKGTLIPVGEDQLPIIEQTNEIVRAFNNAYATDILHAAKPLISRVARLPGIDGKAKMSKSLHNAIFLSDSADTVNKKVMQMYTDPNHIRVEDPGKIECNTVFTYLDAFGTDTTTIAQMKEHYQHGGLGDVKVKRYLADVLNGMLEPLRQRRAVFAQDQQAVMACVQSGTHNARAVARETMAEVRHVLGLNYF